MVCEGGNLLNKFVCVFVCERVEAVSVSNKGVSSGSIELLLLNSLVFWP